MSGRWDGDDCGGCRYPKDACPTSDACKWGRGPDPDQPAEPKPEIPGGHPTVEAWLREEMKVAYCAHMNIPLDVVDGRPWVRTHEEEHPTMLWGNGYPGGCGHELCGDRPWNLTGILGQPGILGVVREGGVIEI